MQFPSPLVRGRLIQRYKRYLADVELDEGGVVTAHVANPGAMLGLNSPGLAVWLSTSTNPKRKLGFTLELVEVETPPSGRLVTVGVNTLHPNTLAAEAILAGAIPELSGYASLRREVRYDTDSRIDILLEDGPENGGRPPAWVEVKNCHFLREPGLAEFPDCVAARSAKHMGALARRAEAGERAVVLWIIQRTDAEAFKVAADIDPAFDAALNAAADAGVEVLAYACEMTREGVEVARRVEWLRR